MCVKYDYSANNVCARLWYTCIYFYVYYELKILFVDKFLSIARRTRPVYYSRDLDNKFYSSYSKIMNKNRKILFNLCFWNDISDHTRAKTNYQIRFISIFWEVCVRILEYPRWYLQIMLWRFKEDVYKKWNRNTTTATNNIFYRQFLTFLKYPYEHCPNFRAIFLTLFLRHST